MQLKKIQRNQIIDALVESGIELATCELSMDDDLMIEHYSTESSFVVSEDRDGYFKGDIRVGDDPAQDFNHAEWEEVPDYVWEWAKDVVEYKDAPDLWAELQHTKEVLASTQYETSENTPFTPDEQAEISNQLSEIKASLKENSELTAEQVSRIEDRLDEAEEASRRIGRKDWLLLFSGTIFTLIVTDCLTPEIAQHILMVTLHGLSHLFLGGIKPIPGPHLK